MKKKMPMILFVISFIPSLLILIYAIISAIFGFTFIFNTYYGLEAFINCILLMIIFLSVYIPIIPLCILYQLFYIFRKKVKKFKNMDKK